MLPDRVALHLAAAGAGALDLAFWDDVQGFSYAPVRPHRNPSLSLRDPTPIRRAGFSYAPVRPPACAPLRRPAPAWRARAALSVPVHARGCLLCSACEPARAVPPPRSQAVRESPSPCAALGPPLPSQFTRRPATPEPAGGRLTPRTAALLVAPKRCCPASPVPTGE